MALSLNINHIILEWNTNIMTSIFLYFVLIEKKYLKAKRMTKETKLRKNMAHECL